MYKIGKLKNIVCRLKCFLNVKNINFLLVVVYFVNVDVWVKLLRVFLMIMVFEVFCC